MDGYEVPAPLNCKTLALANLKNKYQITEDAWNMLSFTSPVNITMDDLRKSMQ
jgi:hypothetical protein